MVVVVVEEERWMGGWGDNESFKTNRDVLNCEFERACSSCFVHRRFCKVESQQVSFSEIPPPDALADSSLLHMAHST